MPDEQGAKRNGPEDPARYRYKEFRSLKGPKLALRYIPSFSASQAFLVMSSVL